MATALYALERAKERGNTTAVNFVTIQLAAKFTELVTRRLTDAELELSVIKSNLGLFMEAEDVLHEAAEAVLLGTAEGELPTDNNCLNATKSAAYSLAVEMLTAAYD